MDTVLLISPITAWRMWRIRGSSLVSIYSSISWPKKEVFTALCKHNFNHTSPFENCDCGIYGLKKPNFDIYYFGELTIIGKVSLWGNIIEGTDGYRAQFAYPISIESVLCNWCGNETEKGLIMNRTSLLPQFFCPRCIGRKGIGFVESLDTIIKPLADSYNISSKTLSEKRQLINI